MQSAKPKLIFRCYGVFTGRYDGVLRIRAISQDGQEIVIGQTYPISTTKQGDYLTYTYN
jgi:hypothetical protein